jgi:hypothetical protein
LFFGIKWSPRNFGFVAWLDEALLRYLNSDPDHSIINNTKHRGDRHLPQSCATPQRDWNCKRGPQSPSGRRWCLFCGITWSPRNFGFVAWLDEALLRYVNSDPDHSVIDNKMHRGDRLPQSCATPQRDWNCKRGPQSPSGQHWCLFCGITWSPRNFGFVAWLDEALLRYVNSDPDHSVINNKTHRGDCLPQSYTSPVKGHDCPHPWRLPEPVKRQKF